MQTTPHKQEQNKGIRHRIAKKSSDFGFAFYSSGVNDFEDR